MNYTKILIFTIIASIFITSCKDDTDDTTPSNLTLNCNTTETKTNGNGYTYTYNDEDQLLSAGDITFTYENGLLTGWNNSEGKYSVLQYETGTATFPNSCIVYGADSILTRSIYYTSESGYLTSVVTENAADERTSAYFFEYDAQFNLTKWSADLAMGPPGTPVTENAMVVTNIITDGKTNPYTRDMGVQLLNYGLMIHGGSSNFVSGDYSSRGSDPLPCSSQFTYDDNDNVTANIFTLNTQTINFTYAYDCK